MTVNLPPIATHRCTESGFGIRRLFTCNYAWLCSSRKLANHQTCMHGMTRRSSFGNSSGKGARTLLSNYATTFIVTRTSMAAGSPGILIC